MIERLTAPIGGFVRGLRAEVGPERTALAGTHRPSRSPVPTTPVPPVGLFECPDCGTVYVAPDEHNCSRCGVAADRIPSTLSTE